MAHKDPVKHVRWNLFQKSFETYVLFSETFNFEKNCTLLFHVHFWIKLSSHGFIVIYDYYKDASIPLWKNINYWIWRSSKFKLGIILTDPLREKFPNTHFFFWSIFPVFSPSTGKYGPEKAPYRDTFLVVIFWENKLTSESFKSKFWSF